MITTNYHNIITADAFNKRLKMLCYERGDTVSNVEKKVGAYQSYFANKTIISDYDLRVVSKYFGMTKDEFIGLPAYEVLRVPQMTLVEKNYSKAEWEVISKIIKEVKDERKRNKNM